MPNWIARLLNCFRRPRIPSLRKLVYGDMPLPDWLDRRGDADPASEPWRTFAMARREFILGSQAEAEAHLRQVLAMPGLDTRHYLQVWHALAGLDLRPSGAEADTIYGLVVEARHEAGLDVLAAYRDGVVRYAAAAGGILETSEPDPEREILVQKLLAAANPLLTRVSPWQGKRLEPPPLDNARISLLTAAGPHFGQGPSAQLAKDPLASEILARMSELVRYVVQAHLAKPPPRPF